MNPDADECDDEEPRWLIVNDAPSLSGESAQAVVELLWAMAETIESEYAAEIIGHIRCVRPVTSSWSPPREEHQLLLDLGDADDF